MTKGVKSYNKYSTLNCLKFDLGLRCGLTSPYTKSAYTPQFRDQVVELARRAQAQ